MRTAKIIRSTIRDHKHEPRGPVPAPSVVRDAVIRDPGIDTEVPYPTVLRSEETHLTPVPIDIYTEELEPDLPVDSADDAEESQDSELDPDRIRKEVETEWSRKLEDAVLSVREEAFGAGYGRARDELEASVEQTRSELSADLERWKLMMDEFRESLEVRAVELALDAAQAELDFAVPKVAQVEMERSLVTAIEDLSGDGAVEVSLHPVDLLRIQESGFDAQISSLTTSLRWSPDETLEQGDWSARTPKAVVRRIRREMIEHIRTRLGVDNEGGL